MPEPSFQDYALGWFVEDDYGHTVVEHDGAVFGALAALDFIPEKHVAFAVNINSEPVSPLADFSFDYQDLHFRPAS